jgi:hypothetical protein
VPFTGDRRVFLARASRRSLNPPRILDLREDALELFVDGPFAKNTSLRANFDAQIETIRQHLDWARADIGPYNARLRAEVPDMVRRRREELLTARNTQAQIGFPILRRAEAQTYPVPLVKRPFRPARPTPKAGAPFKPEPALEQADYEAALGVLRYWRDSLERSPSIVDGRGEEEIRDLLLGALNLVFEGAAAGEVFNGDGKTDILIRVDNAHIFIGECKIWTGVDSMDEALAQIFKYLVWRDTKAAILLFIRNKDATTVIEKAMKQIKDHPNFKRTESPLAASEYNFVMHATGDPLREIRLALVPFALRAKSIRLGRS